jgi:hypothetical protein
MGDWPRSFHGRGGLLEITPRRTARTPRTTHPIVCTAVVAGAPRPHTSQRDFLPSLQREKPCGPKPGESGFAYLSTTITRLTLPLRSNPSCTRVPGRTRCGSIALPSLSKKRTFLPSIYDTGLVSGEDCTTIGEGGSTFLRPGLNAVTVPIQTAPVVICVGARCTWPVCLTTEVFATGCPNARGAIIAQARTIVIRLMGFPFIELTFPTVPTTQQELAFKVRLVAKVVIAHHSLNSPASS